jgi:ribosomal protein S11
MPKKKKEKQIPSTGKAFIVAGMNNTIITITDDDGNTLFSGSAGKSGFKGSKNLRHMRQPKAAVESRHCRF